MIRGFFALVFDLYECTNEMVLSTRSLKRARSLSRGGPVVTAPNPSFLKANSPIVVPMLVRARHIAMIAAFALAGAMLCGCSSVNERMGPGIGDMLPQWAGGLPSDVPPRRGTPEYDAYVKAQEKKRLEPTPTNANASVPGSPSPQSLDPVH
jgi:hypothetical protein